MGWTVGQYDIRGDLLEHVDHVVQVNKRIVDGHNLGTLGHGGSQDETTDTTETVDTDLLRGSRLQP